MTTMTIGAQAIRPTTIDCPYCRRRMRVAAQHMSLVVACPHCEGVLDPSDGAPVSQSYPPPPPIQRPHGDEGSRRYAYRHVRPPDVAGYSWRNRWVAGILGVLLGPFGVHRFYLGYSGIGILQIILTFATFSVVGLWGFIEGILILTTGKWRDVDGLPLRE